MFKSIFKKLFCCHIWEQHSINTYKWTEREIVTPAGCLEPLDVVDYYKTHELEYETHNYRKTVEILYCSECGKIKKIVS